MRLLRFLLPAPQRGEDGRLYRGPAPPYRGGGAPHCGPSGGHGVFRRRHPQLSGRTGYCPAADRASAVPWPGTRRSRWRPTPTAPGTQGPAALRRAGFNRISLGVQSADDACSRASAGSIPLSRCRRPWPPCRKAGLNNLSLDLIYGLPGQTMEDWQRTLADAVALGPEHLSCYGLKLEEGTPLWQQRQALTLPDDDAQADMYLYTVAALGRRATSSTRSPILPAGPGVPPQPEILEHGGVRRLRAGGHSDFGGVRYGYVRDLDRYIAAAGAGGVRERQTLARDYEYVMLSLRTAAGIDRRTSRTATASGSILWRSCSCSTSRRGWRPGRRAAGA